MQMQRRWHLVGSPFTAWKPMSACRRASARRRGLDGIGDGKILKSNPGLTDPQCHAQILDCKCRHVSTKNKHTKNTEDATYLHTKLGPFEHSEWVSRDKNADFLRNGLFRGRSRIRGKTIIGRRHQTEGDPSGQWTGALHWGHGALGGMEDARTL